MLYLHSRETEVRRSKRTAQHKTKNKNLELGSLRKEDKPITEKRWRSSIETTRIDDKGHERRIETFDSKVSGDRPAGDPLEKSFHK